MWNLCEVSRIIVFDQQHLYQTKALVTYGKIVSLYDAHYFIWSSLPAVGEVVVVEITQ